jgi:hypothetical protein
MDRSGCPLKRDLLPKLTAKMAREIASRRAAIEKFPIGGMSRNAIPDTINALASIPGQKPVRTATKITAGKNVMKGGNSRPKYRSMANRSKNEATTVTIANA